MAASPKISVVIPSYNEATYIDRLLEALNHQTLKDFEVIVSDAQSNDGTKEVIDSFKKQLDIKLVGSPPMGPGAGRNRGAEIARGEWLLFMDADVNVDDTQYLDTLLSRAELNGWGTASAKMRIKASLIERLALSIFYHYQKLLAHTKHPVAQGYCILTKLSVFEEAKGFDETIHYGEDNDYVSRVGPRYGFGFVDKTYYYIDLRRNEQEGMVSLAWKSIYHELYRLTHKNNLHNQPFTYEFGKHPKRQK